MPIRSINDNSLYIEEIKKAFVFATNIHAYQKRKNGDPYIIHPIAVADILFEIGCGSKLMMIGLLHDTLEDALDKEKAHKEMKEQFSIGIYNAVRALTKNELLEEVERETVYLAQIKKFSLDDIGILFVKVADLLHNLSTIEHLKPIKKEKWLSELQKKYLPILNTYFDKMPTSYQKNYTRLMDKMLDKLSLIT
jgi:GTP pyrophosphokinase